jgi:hypothetical protein
MNSKSMKHNRNNKRNDPYIRSLIGEQLLRLIHKYPHKGWNWNYISYNPNITFEFIDKYPDKSSSWWGISRNPSITMEMIEKNPTKPWNWHYISNNPNITIEFIEKNPDKPWNWYCISSNPFNGMYDEIQERYSSRLLLVQARNRMR